MTAKQIPARQYVKDAQDALLDLTAYVTAHHEGLDLLHVQLLASKVSVAIDAAHHELSHATCDIEASLHRL